MVNSQGLRISYIFVCLVVQRINCEVVGKSNRKEKVPVRHYSQSVLVPSDLNGLSAEAEGEVWIH